MTEKVKYNGRTYRRYPDSKHRHLRVYFHTTGKRRGFLHRHVWEDHNGEIPEGFEIHHVNEDTLDNSIGNLELVKVSEHRAYHLSKRSKTKEHLAHLDAIRDKTKEWHASPEGRAKHSEVAKKSWIDRKPLEKVCICCENKYLTYFPKRSKYCGHSCEVRFKRRGSDRDYRGVT